MLVWFWLYATVHAATLAVLPFDNHTGDAEHDALGTGVAVMLMSDLGSISSLQLVERSRLQDVLSELELQQSDFVDPKTAAEAGKVMGADWILTGALMAVEPDLRLDARIVEVGTGRILGTSSARGPLVSFFDVEKDLALSITDELGLALSAREAARVGRVATESFQAFRAWSEGLSAIDRGKVDEARERFADALRFDSGFSAANSALDELRAAVDRSEVLREKQFAEELAWLEAYAADHARGKADDKKLTAMLMRIQAPLQMRPPAVQKTVARMLIDLELPERVEVWQGMSVNQFATWLMISASTRSRDREGVLTWSQTYLDRYPNGIYFTAVRSQLDIVMGQIDKERKARASGARRRIEAAHRFEMYERRCAHETIPEQRVVECRRMLTSAADAPEVDYEDLLEEILEGARDGGDLKLAEDALAYFVAQVSSPQARREAKEDVDEFRDDLASLDEAEKTFEEQLRRGSRYPDRYLRPFMEVGAYARAMRLAERIPDAEQRAEVKWEGLVALGRVEELKPIHAAVMDDPDPFVSESRRASDIERLERDAGFVRFAETTFKLAVASDLQDAGLLRDAAELLDEVVEKHIDQSLLEPSSLLLIAAMGWRQVYTAEAVEREQTYMQRIVDEYPDSTEAETARTMLATAQ